MILGAADSEVWGEMEIERPLEMGLANRLFLDGWAEPVGLSRRNRVC